MSYWRLLLLARITRVVGQVDAHQRYQNLGQGRRRLAGKTKLSKLDDDALMKHINLRSGPIWAVLIHAFSLTACRNVIFKAKQK